VKIMPRYHRHSDFEAEIADDPGFDKLQTVWRTPLALRESNLSKPFEREIATAASHPRSAP